MHCYGQGSQRAEMERLAAGKPIVINGAIPYPELVERSKTFDIFVCCHIQSDPSCTYLEAMGAGLPIASYVNRMAKGLRQPSKAIALASASPWKLANRIEWMTLGLPAMSRHAREFALAHSFEVEHGKRIAAINLALETGSRFRSSFGQLSNYISAVDS
jgi:hypothetical protein